MPASISAWSAATIALLISTLEIAYWTVLAAWVISLCPSPAAVGDIVGVEGDAGLIDRADANARRNGISNATFHAADLAANQAASAWARAGYDKLLLDPPRSGAAAVLDYLPRKGTNRIVYVSCHPGSLARDAGTLVNRHGFSLTKAGVMDMFPNTAHVESIALFER